MQKEIFLHISLPCSRNDQIIKSLRSNSKFFAQFGVYTPDPFLYRSRIIKYLEATDDRIMTKNGRDAFWSNIGACNFSRVILSVPRIKNLPHSIIDSTGLLPDLNTFVRRILHFFTGHKITLLIGIVNPRDLLLSMIKYGVDFGTVSKMIDICPDQFWSDALGACIDEFPEISVQTWRHETSHLNWSSILRRVGRVNDDRFIPGSVDMAADLLRYDDLKDIYDHVKRIPPQNDYHFRKIVHSYVKRPFLIEEDSTRLDVLGWSAGLIRYFDENYSQDLNTLRSDKDINLIF